MKNPRLDTRKEFIFLLVPAGRIKGSRGPYVAHACIKQLYRYIHHHLLHNVEALSYVLKDTPTRINRSKTVAVDD